jgi:ribosomal protein S18 acetylase RimI-like enzyme
VIRTATRDDAEAFATVITAAQATWVSWAGAAFQPYQAGHLAEHWSSRLTDPATLAFVACTEQGQVVAVAAAGPEAASFEPSDTSADSAHLSTLFALPESHGSGVAQELHDHLLVALGHAGYRTVRLWVPEGAAQARRFYERNGWTLTGKTTVFAGLARVEMRRSVGLVGQPGDRGRTGEVGMSTPPGYLLRPERPDDLEQLATLLVAVDEAWGEVPFRYAVREGGLPAARDVIGRPKIDSVVSEIDGEVVGYCALRETDGVVLAVNGLVAPTLQGHGIGTAMLAELCTRAQARGQHVHCEVLLDSHASYQMCTKLGFREYGRFAGKLSGREGRLLCLAPDGVESCADGYAPQT